MFIAHLPAGYLITQLYLKRQCFSFAEQHRAWLVGVGLFASVLPDVDLLYFYWFDQRQHNHHSYWTHTPVFWLAIFLLPCVVVWITKQKLLLTTIVVLLMNVMLHLLLDSIAAEILWLYPVVKQSFGLVEVPAQFAWWPLNFLLHWSFMLEVLIVGTALYQLKRQYSLKYQTVNIQS
ncbi:metal-dependent hydrolase [Endozoicomonas sp. SM1973]|uniref:Metal-dependent hydrolase n=1 Tax=Spartinivicinus marinus TaxID=2994442 RepID=A0A853I4T5_9GAMM|nr:metal-dependent hydrolase [Spartinivicinus marinus]MCX4029579.1 metal-dependent hydrolase [Spartinivicinus marinus]NYZ65154.1 metal-dependent hydrolase [Spartinivicinus marinus]